MDNLKLSIKRLEVEHQKLAKENELLRLQSQTPTPQRNGYDVNASFPLWLYILHILMCWLLMNDRNGNMSMQYSCIKSIKALPEDVIVGCRKHNTIDCFTWAC